MQITGIILSGGLSTRMGSDKALLKVNGKPLLENAINICRQTCTEILISSDNPKHQNFGFQVIPDQYKKSGPLSGIYSCLKSSNTEWNFVLSVDAAFVLPSFIEELKGKTGQFDAIVPVHKNGKEPLISLFNKSALPIMKEHLESANFKMYNLINALDSYFYDSQKWVKKHPTIFHNLNSPDDIQIVSKYISL